MTKAAMLSAFARSDGRSDVQIKEMQATTMIDRTLTTLDDATNGSLWSAADYASPPTVAEMIEETARYRQNFGRLATARQDGSFLHNLSASEGVGPGATLPASV
jgi:hypothetical protein